MIICTKCLVEMSCKKTGVFVRWKKEYIKAGDLMICPECGCEVISISPNTEGFNSTKEFARTLIFEMEE